MSENNEQKNDGRASTAIGRGLKYALYVVIIYYIVKWLGWID